MLCFQNHAFSILIHCNDQILVLLGFFIMHPPLLLPLSHSPRVTPSLGQFSWIASHSGGGVKDVELCNDQLRGEAGGRGC